MQVGFGMKALKSMRRPLDKMALTKNGIVRVNTEKNCLAHAVIIAIARVDNDPNCDSYRKGRKIRPEVDSLLQATGVDLTWGGKISELGSFQQYFYDRYKTVVYNDLKVIA
jgi:hypothetical protein